MTNIFSLKTALIAASRFSAIMHPEALKFSCLVTTMFVRFGRGLHKCFKMDSYVFLPIITVWPFVTVAKYFISSESRQGILPLLPIAPFFATAAMRETVMKLNCDRNAFNARMRVVVV